MEAVTRIRDETRFCISPQFMCDGAHARPRIRFCFITYSPHFSNLELFGQLHCACCCGSFVYR
jgi:hypothetical protein